MSRPHMDDWQRAVAIQLYMDGGPLRVIAEYYDRHIGVIRCLVKRAGVQRGHRWRTKYSKKLLLASRLRLPERISIDAGIPNRNEAHADPVQLPVRSQPVQGT